MDEKPIRILLIEDNPGDVRLLQEKLKEVSAPQHGMVYTDALSIGLQHLATGGFDLVLLDLTLPDSRGFDTFKKVHEQAPQVPIVVLTGIHDEALAIKIVQQGAQDYLVKGQVDGSLLLRTMRYAIERKKAESKLEEMVARIEKSRDDMLLIMNQLHLGVAMTDEEGHIIFLSDFGQRLLCKEKKEIVGVPWENALELEGDAKESLKAMFEKGHESRKRIPVVRRAEDGRQYHMEIDLAEDPCDPRRKIFFIYDMSEVHYLRQQLHGNIQFHDLIGKSKGMRIVYQQIQDLANVDSTVLIEGETGTGKELVARIIHTAGARSEGPFLAVNCAGLTESLVASQLFGHKKGAFTGAFTDQKGLFESANEGTLFLDEIGDIPMSVQTNLLRALQEREILRIGESMPRPINVRFLAATQHDLQALVAEGAFRMDLFYRLRVARVQLPPLRDRREDIPLLAVSFLKQFQSSIGKGIGHISDNAMRILMEYDWPGNIRELKNAIEFAVIHCKRSVIQPEDLPPEIIKSENRPAMSWACQDVKSRLMLSALEKAGGNHTLAARMLGIGRSTLYRRMARLGISPEERHSIKINPPILTLN